MRQVSKDRVELVQFFSDGTEGIIGEIGFTFAKYDSTGVMIDSVLIPNGGTLRLQTQFKGK